MKGAPRGFRPVRPILAVLLLAAGFLPAALRAQTAPLSLDQNAFLYDTNYSPFGAALVPPGINWQSLSATIPNPSFETGNFSGWTTDAAGSSEAGVTTAGGSFANNGMIPQGVQVAWLQSFTAPVSISTTIANLIPGISYQVSFGANMRSGYGAPTAAWSLNGGPFVGFTASPAVGGSNPYYTITRSFTATGDTAALVIQNSNVSDSTLLVDDFTILQTPNQSQGFIALGAVTVAANVTLLNSNLNFFQNVTNLNWPRLSKPSGKVLAVLRAAQAGGPVSQGWLRVPGTVATWGNDRAGQLDVPAGLAGIVALAAGDTHSLALTNGGVVGWGSDSYGQLDVPAGLANVRQVAAGGNHSLALTAGGRVFGWGDMGGGQTTVPLGLTAVTFIAAGFDHSLAVANGFVVAWGNNAFGQTTVPAGLSNVIAVAGGQAHSLALLSDGTVVAWGNNQYGQTTVPGSITNGAAVGAGLNVVAIAAGYNHSLALLANGSVVAWGHNQYGQIKVPVSASNVVAISAGSGHSVALRTDGTLVAWGNPAYAQTTFVSQLGRLTAIAAGGIHTLALVGNGQPMLEQQPITQAVPAGGTAVFAALAAGAPPLTYQWYSMGGLMSGQSSSVLTRAGLSQADAGSYSVVVGNALGSTTSAIATLTVESIPTLTPIVLAGQHVTQGASSGAYNAPAGTSLALSVVAAGTPPFTYQWYTNLTALVDNQHLSGSASTNLIIQALTANDSGLYSVVVNNEFGTAVQTVALNVFQPTVLQTVGKTDVTVTSGGSAQWSVQASGDGTFTYQWTFNGTNQPNETGSTLTRNDVSYTNAGIYKVTVTDSYGVSEQSSFFLSLLVGWGDDSSGQTDVPGNLLGVTSVAAGDAHSLAAQIDGTVAAWGADDYGQIEVPMSLTNISSVAAGGNHSLALSGGGQVFAWGDDDSGQSDVPAALTNGTTGVLMIAAGFNHSLAVTTNNAPYAWGDNTYSQTHIPPGLLGVTALAGGVRHTLALGTNGTVTAWGDSTYGQANVPLAITTNMPAESRMPVVAIAAGYYHSLALLTNGTVLAWGNNQFGQTNVPAGLTNVIAIAAGSGLSLALCSTGSVVAWGNPAETQPQFVSGLETVRYLASGGFHNLALVSGGRPPEFQVAPTNRVVLPGDNITLISEAIGTAPLSYQWYFTPNTPPGSTNTMLANTTPTNSLPMIANGNFGVYQIVCSNSFGAVTNSATLSAAIIDPQPTNQTIIQGQPVSFSIAVANVAGLGYHWYFNGIEAAGRGTLLGGGQATYSIPAVSDLNAGYYSVVVTNTAGGSLTSSAAQLTVLVPPSMVNFNPGSLTTNLNSPLTLTAQFTASSNNLSAQWVVNGQAAAGTANQVSYQAPAPPSTLGRYSNYLTISSCQNVNAGQYCLVIGNAAATTTNTGPALSVASGGVVYFPPYVSGQPGGFERGRRFGCGLSTELPMV